MHEETKGSIIIISHQERILNIADRIIVIADGKVAASGGHEMLPTLLGSGNAKNHVRKWRQGNMDQIQKICLRKLRDSMKCLQVLIISGSTERQQEEIQHPILI